VRTLHVGIANFETMKARSLAIARGELKRKKDDPQVWFTSIESFAKILSARNQALLDIIATQKPNSLAELELMSGRAKSNLSRTLKTMQNYGLVELEKGEGGKLIPHVIYDRIALEMPILSS
jgi:predicted transcriptional regulator